MSSYAIDFEDEEGTSGPYDTPEEVAGALEAYRTTHPQDEKFVRVHVWEMPPHASVGTPRSVWDFIEDH
ncbi:MAG TPA: hypothetical protein VFM96_02860 [Gaiellaceae bacterium]|nr:hypothetical protein [Gaiellaceae bacterium]